MSVKGFVPGVLGSALVVLVPVLAGNWSRSDSVRADPSPAAATVPDGYGTDAVVAFYEALLQEAPPTIEQERAAFTLTSAMRHRLVLGDRGEADVEPMTRTPEQRRARELQEKKVAAAGPVVLEYLRKHRDWFLPIGGLKSRKEIAVSSFMRFVRDLEEPKSPSKWGNVIVLFVNDRAARPARFRSIVFPIRGDGKIEPDGIHLDGFSGKTLLEMLFDQEKER